MSWISSSISLLSLLLAFLSISVCSFYSGISFLRIILTWAFPPNYFLARRCLGCSKLLWAGWSSRLWRTILCVTCWGSVRHCCCSSSLDWSASTHTCTLPFFAFSAVIVKKIPTREYDCSETAHGYREMISQEQLFFMEVLLKTQLLCCFCLLFQILK